MKELLLNNVYRLHFHSNPNWTNDHKQYFQQQEKLPKQILLLLLDQASYEKYQFPNLFIL